MAKEKQISTNQLATMVKRGFDAVDKRFDAVDKRFEGVDKRFDAMDERFDAMDRRFDRIENILLRNHSDRLETLEDFMRQVKTTLHIE